MGDVVSRGVRVAIYAALALVMVVGGLYLQVAIVELILRR